MKNAVLRNVGLTCSGVCPTTTPFATPPPRFRRPGVEARDGDASGIGVGSGSDDHVLPAAPAPLSSNMTYARLAAPSSPTYALRRGYAAATPRVHTPGTPRMRMNLRGLAPAVRGRVTGGSSRGPSAGGGSAMRMRVCASSTDPNARGSPSGAASCSGGDRGGGSAGGAMSRGACPSLAASLPAVSMPQLTK